MVNVQRRPVSHKQRAHELEGWDLQWEVERRDEGHLSIGKAVPTALLTRVVAADVEAAGQEADLCRSVW